jgi:hypothetical protein
MAKTQSIISADNDCITLINTYTCAEEKQNELVAALEEATVKVLLHQPGFISANIHASFDRTRVVNYAQWARMEDFDAAGAVDAIQEHMNQIMTLAESADPRLYTVRAVHHS